MLYVDRTSDGVSMREALESSERVNGDSDGQREPEVREPLKDDVKENISIYRQQQAASETNKGNR